MKIIVTLPEINIEGIARGGKIFWRDHDVTDWIDQCAVELDASGASEEIGQVVRQIADALRRARV